MSRKNWLDLIQKSSHLILDNKPIFWERFKLSFDRWNYRWNLWLLGYGIEEQKRVWQQVTTQFLGVLLPILVTIARLAYVFLQWWQRPLQKNTASRNLLKKIDRH